jgi:hypothetical protein
VGAPDTSFLLELGAQERIHFRNLALIRPQLPSETQLQLIEGLARNLASPRLLTLIARTPHWLVHGPILQALAENEQTPEAIRRDLELAVSLFDQMRELDRAPAHEKEERGETIKAVYAQVRPDLKPIVKAQAKAMAKNVGGTGLTAELPPLPTEDPDWEALTLPPDPPVATAAGIPAARLPREERLARASTTHQVEELHTFLADPEPELRQAALRNPLINEELLALALRDSQQPDFFEEVYGEARWYFRESLRAAVRESPVSPQGLSRKLFIGGELLAQLQRNEKDHRSLRRTVSLFTQLDETEYQYITFWAKKAAPSLLRVIKWFYDRLQRRRLSQASGLSVQPEGKWASLEERVFTANQATAPEQLIASLMDPDPKVFTVVLENPGLTPRELLAAIPSLDQHRAERLAAHNGWGEEPAVREALLHNPNITEYTALRLLPHLTVPRALLDLLRDPRIPHLELKRRALDTLRALYQGMSIHERILVLRNTGGELIRHLQAEVLQDEETLRAMISDRQLDPSILLRLARNKQTPRGVLDQIAAHPVLMAHPAIMQELLLNPKTPRDSAIRIWGLLSETEKQMLLRSPHLPAPLRHLNG